jgi:hypothetical protein
MPSINREIVIGKVSKATKSKLFVAEKDFQIPSGEESLRIPISHLNKIQDTLANGKTLPSLLMYDDFSLWWFIQPTVYPEIKKILHFIIKFNEILKQENPSKITITDNFKMFEIIQQICKKNKIPLNYSKTNFLKSKTLKKISSKAEKYRYEKITNDKISLRKKIFFNKTESVPSLKNSYIFGIPSIYRRKKFNYKTGKSENSEYIQQHLIDNIDGNILGMDFDYTFKGSPQVLKERIDSQIDWAPIEVYLKEKNHKNTQKFINKFQKVISDKKFQQLFIFDGISYWKILEHIFNKLTFYPYIPFYIDIVNSLDDIFRNQRPKAIFLPYETGPYALAFIVVAKRFNIITYGIQHGIIFQYSPMYSFEQFQRKESPSGFPLPDYLLLFGNYTKNLLQKNGYPESKLVILGNPEFFEFDKIKDLLSNQDLRKKYNIDPNSKIILFTTGKLQPYYADRGKYDYDIQIWEYLLQKYANNNDYYVILKPHPSETNTQAYEKILQKYTCDNFIIKNGILQEMIHISSVVISVGSTTLIDSLCFDKPVIQVIFENKQFLPMLEENKVVIISNLHDLEKNIMQATSDKNLEQLLTKNRTKFLKDQYNFPDGNFETIKEILQLEKNRF